MLYVRHPHREASVAVNGHVWGVLVAPREWSQRYC